MKKRKRKLRTWKTKRTVCRSRKTGRFVRRKRCGAFKRSRVRATSGTLFS